MPLRNRRGEIIPAVTLVSDVTVMGFNYTEEAALTCSQTSRMNLGQLRGRVAGEGPSPSCPCSQVAAARPLLSVQSALMPPSPSGPQSAPPGVFSALLQRTALCPPGTCRYGGSGPPPGSPPSPPALRERSRGCVGLAVSVLQLQTPCSLLEAPSAGCTHGCGGSKSPQEMILGGGGGPRFPRGVVLGGSFVWPSAHALNW